MVINNSEAGMNLPGIQRSIDELGRRAESAKELTELREVSEDFEALFVKIMLDSMRKTLQGDSLIPKNMGERFFEDKLYDEYAQSMSRTMNLGIAESIYNQLADTVTKSRIDLSA